MRVRWAYRNRFNGQKTPRGYIPRKTQEYQLGNSAAQETVKNALWVAVRAKETRLGRSMSELERLNTMLEILAAAESTN